MEEIIKIALMALMSRLRPAEPMSSKGGRWAVTVCCALLALATMIGAIGCAVAALWLYVAPETGAAAATVIAAFTLLVISIGLVLVGVKLLHKEPAEQRPAFDIPDELIAELKKGFEHNKTAALLAAVLAGFMADSALRRK